MCSQRDRFPSLGALGTLGLRVPWVPWVPWVIGALGTLALWAPAAAQERQSVESLEARIAALEAEGARPGLGMGARYGEVSASFQVFGDVQASYRNPDLLDDANTILSQGSATFLVNAQLGERFRVLSETVLDSDKSASQERLWGSWTFGDELYAKFGTEHSNISRWNQLNHHGAWLETTIERPYFARFEGDDGFLPMHRTGLELGGTVATGAGRIEYYGGISNGRGAVPTDKQRATDVDDEKDFDLGLAFVPEALPDLRVGAALQFNEIPTDPSSSDPLRARSMEETVAAAHVQYRMGDVEVFSELGWVDHEARADGSDYGHTAGYVQVAWERGDWTPYARIDWRNMRQDDPFYAPSDRDLDRWKQILGARCELTQNAAVKFELGYGEEEVRDGASVSEEDVVSFAIQLAWWL